MLGVIGMAKLVGLAQSGLVGWSWFGWLVWCKDRTVGRSGLGICDTWACPGAPALARHGTLTRKGQLLSVGLDGRICVEKKRYTLSYLMLARCQTRQP